MAPTTLADNGLVDSGLASLLAAQRKAFAAEGPPGLEERRADLSALHSLLTDNRKAIIKACREDFGARSAYETEIAEIATTLHTVKFARRNVAKWMKPRRRSVGIWFMPAANRIVPQPKGCVGIMVPFNFPVNLAVGPLTSALAAGNRVMIKTSECTPHTGELLARLLADRFSPEKVVAVGGEMEVSQEFASLPFDHLLFTGSTAVGRHVMRAAAENLTPVTLELGGKSPVIVGEDYPLARAAQRIVWGKLVNAGQICIAPDYVLVPEGKEREFATYVQAAARKFYPKLTGNDDYTAVINDAHYERLIATVDDARAKGAVIETAADPADSRGERKLPLTVVLDPTDEMRVSQEEIFGPVLPVRGYRTVDDAITYVNEHPRPLALYLFTEERATQDRVLEQTTSGGVAINDTLMHYMQDDMPFGGVGPSGMGVYHTQEGFNTFSHLKPVFRQASLGPFTGAQLLYPPYGPVTKVLLRLMRRI
ncbi:MAG TPA: coniferyl aldehyde dehydrogenase [Acidimicrobiia bacterium]|nr:coniferyl aldehyde dehydrogenase [Acidimicrobiia bacterium]